MKFNKASLMVAVLSLGCAHGSTGPIAELEETSSDDYTSSQETFPTDEVEVPPVESTPPPEDPYAELNDQAIIYTVDQAFWTAYMATISYGDETVPPTTLNCWGGGSIQVQGVQAGHTEYQYNQPIAVLELDFDLMMNDCFYPDALVDVNIILSGPFHVKGELYGGAYEDHLTFTSPGMSFRGAIKYVFTDHPGFVIEHIRETCKFNFLDDFLESQGLGGLGGKLCGRQVFLSEYDPSN